MDDTGVALKGLDPGVRYNEVEDKMEIKKELIESDKDVPEDERTMKELNKIGSSIHPSIKTTFDFPSKNQNLKMPLLDLEVWTENNKVRFSHYEKPMSSKFTIPIQSAHSWKMKMAVLHREAVRRMLNMDKDHSWEEVTSVLNKYSRKLERSGYSSSTRADIIRSAIQTYKRMRKEDRENKRPLYRPREWHEHKRNLEKESKKSSWSKNGKMPGEVARAPLIICPQAGNSLTSRMKDICQKFAKEHNIHVKVVTRGGSKMTRDLRSNPLRVGGCGRGDCMVCSQGGKGDCSRSGAGYRISCLECPNVKIEAAYEGETARNPYSRGLEHLKDLENKSEKSPLWKHCTIQHEGRTVNFKMEALRSFKYPMVRQVNEGARVRLSKADICMNSKSEFHQPGIVRVIPVRGNVNEEQAGISLQAGRGGARGGARGRGRAGQGGRARRGVRSRGQ